MSFDLGGRISISSLLHVLGQLRRLLSTRLIWPFSDSAPQNLDFCSLWRRITWRSSQGSVSLSLVFALLFCHHILAVTPTSRWTLPLELLVLAIRSTVTRCRHSFFLLIVFGTLPTSQIHLPYNWHIVGKWERRTFSWGWCWGDSSRPNWLKNVKIICTVYWFVQHHLQRWRRS